MNLLISKGGIMQNQMIDFIGAGAGTEYAKESTERVSKDSNNKKGKMASCITALPGCIMHELRTTLSIVQLYAELLGNNCKRGASSDKDRRFAISCVDTIRQTVKNADYLLGNLLLQAKGITKGGVNKKDFRIYSIRKNIEEVLEQYPLHTSERQLMINLNGDDFKYIGNPILTNHILFNLFRNAARAIKGAGKGTITITLQSDRISNYLIFADTATGVPQDFLPQIFNQFASQMTTEGGVGLGLTFCKIIMNSYGGNITCNSKEGEYTEFTLRFPRVLLQR
jgi:signal transduction histidine kinase